MSNQASNGAAERAPIDADPTPAAPTPTSKRRLDKDGHLYGPCPLNCAGAQGCVGCGGAGRVSIRPRCPGCGAWHGAATAELRCLRSALTRSPTSAEVEAAAERAYEVFGEFQAKARGVKFVSAWREKKCPPGLREAWREVAKAVMRR